MVDICHAIAITIGTVDAPRCDTFCEFLMKGKGGDLGSIGSVGACKVPSCIYNTGLECQAIEIFVGYKDEEPECLTFQTSSVEGIREGGVISSRKTNSNIESQAPEIFIG